MLVNENPLGALTGVALGVDDPEATEGNDGLAEAAAGAGGGIDGVAARLIKLPVLAGVDVEDGKGPQSKAEAAGGGGVPVDLSWTAPPWTREDVCLEADPRDAVTPGCDDEDGGGEAATRLAKEKLGAAFRSSEGKIGGAISLAGVSRPRSGVADGIGADTALGACIERCSEDLVGVGATICGKAGGV